MNDDLKVTSDFWAGVRDIAVLGVSLLTFGGLVYYHYYLAAFGITDESLQFNPSSVFVFGTALLVRHSFPIIAIAVFLGLATFAVWTFGNTSWHATIRRILGTELTRLLFAGVAISAIYLTARTDAARETIALRTGNSRVVSSITFRSEHPDSHVASSFYSTRLTRLPDVFWRANSQHRPALIPIFETGDAYYMLFQDPHPKQSPRFKEYPNGAVFAISKREVVAVTSYIPDFKVTEKP